MTKLPTFDIEYLFLNVRSKSVGESVEVNITCPDDGKTKVETSINIDDTYPKEFLEEFYQRMDDIDTGKVRTYPADDILKRMKELITMNNENSN